MEKIKVLFVCLGNICRSPLAEAIFKAKVSERGFEQWIEADSCGTSNYHIGELPDPRTIANAKKNGIAIQHRGRQLSPADLAYYDFIVAMDKSNYDTILRVDGAKTYTSKIMLMRSFDKSANSNEVPDPYYGNEQHFQQVFEILDQSVNSFLNFIESNHLKLNQNL